MCDLTPHDKLYFGSLETAFAPVAGVVVPFNAADYQFDPTSLAAVVERGKPGGADLGDGKPGVVVPAVPCLDYVCVRPGGEARAGPDAPFPAPLIRVPPAAAGAGAERGVASGTRSALIKRGGGGGGSGSPVWYRLKGCGNNEEGFVVREVPAQGGAPAWRDVRGSAFVKESLTELSMCARVAAALAPADSLCANGAVAFARYQGAAQLPFGERVPTACVIETTLGDRRLGTHVLAGFDLAWDRLLSAAAAPGEGEACPFDAAFPPARPRAPEQVTCAAGCGWLIDAGRFRSAVDPATGAPWLAGEDPTRCSGCVKRGRPPVAGGGRAVKGAVVNSADFAEGFVLERAIEYESFLAGGALGAGSPDLWAGTPRDASTLANLCAPGGAAAARALAAAERASLPALRDPASRPPQFTRVAQEAGTAAEVAMGAEWAAQWDRSAAELAAALAVLPEGASALAYLHARLGFDAGCIVRALHAAGLSWGTYQDAMCRPGMGDWHCNAHSNNLVVVAEGLVPPGAPGAQRLLCMLDIDMAFDAPSYVFLDGPQRGTLGMAPETMARLLRFERWNMMSVLSGADTTSGVPRDLLPKATELMLLSPHLLPIKNCLKDTLVSGFLAGLEGSEAAAVPRFDPLLHAAAHAYIRLAICVMGNYAA